MSTENSYKSSPFWEHYHSVVLNHAIPEARAEWYLKWAQRFALSGEQGYFLENRVTFWRTGLQGLQGQACLLSFEFQQRTKKGTGYFFSSLSVLFDLPHFRQHLSFFLKSYDQKTWEYCGEARFPKEAS